jgi:YVTN family beta-propeller protein
LIKMANKVAEVEVVTEALRGVPLGDPTTPLRPASLPALRHMPSAMVRSHLQRLPEAAPVVAEKPLMETDLAPGYTVVGQALVGRGVIADLSVSPRGGYIYATNQVDNSVSVLDPETLAVVANVAGLDEPFLVKAAGTRAYVSTVSAAYDAVTVIDAKAGTIVATHPLASSVRDLALSRDGRRIYVARSGADGADVAVIDTVTGSVTTLDLGTRRVATAEAIAISRDGTRVYVATADHLGGELVAIDTRDHRIAGSCAFAAPVRGIAVSPDGATVFVAGYDTEIGAHVDIVDARSCNVTGTVPVGGSVTQLLLSAEGDRAYVVNGEEIAVLCTATHEIIDTVTVGAEPACIAESRDGKRVFVADYDGRVTAFSVASTTESLLAKMMEPAALAMPALRELTPVGV